MSKKLNRFTTSSLTLLLLATAPHIYADSHENSNKDQEMTTEQTSQKIRLADYQTPNVAIPKIDLKVDIFDDHTEVVATMQITPTRPGEPLKLDGKELTLKDISIDGKVVEPSEYTLTDSHLTLHTLPNSPFTLQTRVHINPKTNQSGDGFYDTEGTLLTQCESHGFQRITYFPDRPDLPSRYTCTMSADRSTYPVLLANGNLTEKKLLDNGRHLAAWEDPYPKPCYLFAMVAGDLVKVEEKHTTPSGRNVTIEVYAKPGQEEQIKWAAKCYKHAMEWDEKNYDREYDLDTMMVVAADKFNAGAMENKGLNIFNSVYILADEKSATDHDFIMIDDVCAHEYFHNWTGNRVTVRDWFHITLKEGLTSFREQEYTRDRYSRGVYRIKDVRGLRSGQFPEDASPMAHPIRPEEYEDISNFYTATVYSKGAEIYRMLEFLMGKEGWKKAMNHYFEKHDGDAVTLEDLVTCLEESSGKDFSQFSNWYNQAGTPQVHVESRFDAEKNELHLTVKQSCPFPADPNKKPYLFPFAVGFLDQEGSEMTTTHGQQSSTNHTLWITKPEETFVFSGVSSEPIPSLLRDFCAPVQVHYNYSKRDLCQLLEGDSDQFNQWDAGQRLALVEINRLMDELNEGKKPTVDPLVTQAFERALANSDKDPAFTGLCIGLPDLATILQQRERYEIDQGYEAREMLKLAVAKQCEEKLKSIYTKLDGVDSIVSFQEASAARSLKNTALSYLHELGTYDAWVVKQYENAKNMTDKQAALFILADSEGADRDRIMAAFHKEWKEDSRVMNRWFLAHSRSEKRGAVAEELMALESDEAYDKTNPNKVRSLVGAFGGNLKQFHRMDGVGYHWMADKLLELSEYNPHVAGRLSKVFQDYPKLDKTRKALMQKELERILAKPDLPVSVREVITRILQG